MMLTRCWTIAVSLTAVVAVSIPVGGQQPRTQAAAAGGASAGVWAARAAEMLGRGALELSRTQADTMAPGRVHERLAQWHEGLPVFGGELVRQRSGSNVLSVFGRVFEDVYVPATTPDVDVATAIATALADAGPGSSVVSSELGIQPSSVGYTLAYRIRVRTAAGSRRYSINAATGEITQAASEVRRQAGPAIVLGTGILRDQKKLSVTRTATGFEAIDLLRPAPGFTLDFRGSLTRLNTFLATGALFATDVATNTTSTWSDRYVTDAHVHQGWVYDYYRKRFGRRGLDDRDTELVTIVHPLLRSSVPTLPAGLVDDWVNNAAYLPLDNVTVFGDGDGIFFDAFASALDIVAHEMTHGVTEFSSRLEYQDESGALNEAFSDIMGTAAEFYLIRAGQGPQGGPNFVLGDDITHAFPGFVRSLQNPIAAGDPDHYSLRRFIGTNTDNGGVHSNCTIVGHAFYLAVAGGRNRVSGITVQGIGVANMERMERIFYRAFVFLLGPLSQFSDARAATLQAATELFGAGSTERAQLLQAWNAVGVP
jgi:thermolysin